MIEWRKPELDYVKADCSALNQEFGRRRKDVMLYEEFTDLIGRDDITYTFYKDVIEPMYIAAPEEIDKETFCNMINTTYLYYAQTKYFDSKNSVSMLENERCRRLAKMFYNMGLSFNELLDNPYSAGSKSWDLWNRTIRHLEDLKNA